MPDTDRFQSAANRLIATLQELNFPMPAIDEEIDTPAEQKWRDTIASILREHFGDEEDARLPGNDSGSTSSARAR